MGNRSQPDSVTMLRTQQPYLVGISGWLFLFCLGTAILAPLGCAFQYSHSRGNSQLMFIGLAVLYGFSGTWVWLRKPEALTMVRVMLFTVMGLSAYQLLQLIFQEPGIGNNARVEALGAGMMRRLCWALGWYLYFKYSKRVLATFGENI